MGLGFKVIVQYTLSVTIEKKILFQDIPNLRIEPMTRDR